MQLGKVCGSVWATKKSDKLTGSTLLIVKTKNSEIIAADTLGAGVGDTVLLLFGGAAREISGTDAAICGIVDKTDYKRKEDEYEY